MGERKNKAEEAVREWLAERGYDYEVRTYVPDTSGTDSIKKEKDMIAIPDGVEDVESFMEQFVKTFEQINGITELQKLEKAQGL